MEWEVEFTEEFAKWWNGLSDDEQDSVDRKCASCSNAVPHFLGRTPMWSGSRGTRI
jgi:hypothetical protein